MFFVPSNGMTFIELLIIIKRNLIVYYKNDYNKFPGNNYYTTLITPTCPMCQDNGIHARHVKMMFKNTLLEVLL